MISHEKKNEAQLGAGYESNSDFGDAFSRILGAAPAKLEDSRILKASRIDTMLGPMIAIADEEALYLLEFVNSRGLERKVERLRQKTKSAIIPGCTKPIAMIEKELEQYFKETLKEFKTPLHILGSPFQKKVWDELLKIPPGETRSYAQVAKALGKPTAFRAVAQSNGANQLAIVIPCHRVINTNGEIGGYGGGVTRKQWMLHHEKKRTIKG